MVAFIGLIGTMFFLSSCDGAVNQDSQEVDGGYGGNNAGGSLTN